MTKSLHTVHVRVNDAATRRPTPCRIRFTGPDGAYYPPLGRLGQFATAAGQDVGGNVQVLTSNGPKAFAYIDGACEIPLPAGLLRVQIAKGPEYPPIDEQVSLPSGKLALRFELKRGIDPASEGWFSGDTEAYHLSPHAALLEGMAEGLSFVNLLACEIQGPAPGLTTLSNILAFSGVASALESQDCQVIVNTRNQSEILGSFILLGCHRVVYPLSLGSRESGSSWRLGAYALADWCDQCHRKKGVVLAGLETQDSDSLPTELLAELILGKVDAIQTRTLDPRSTALRLWYSLLNAGFRIPLVGGSGKDSNSTVLGSLRTYARLAAVENSPYRRWLEALRRGHTLVTHGPFLELIVDGGSVCEEKLIPQENSVVPYHVKARSLAPEAHVELILNGKVVMELRDLNKAGQGNWQGECSMKEGGWLAARLLDRDDYTAHTAPLYFRIPGKGFPWQAESVAWLHQLLDQSLIRLNRECQFETSAQKERLHAIVNAARDKLSAPRQSR